MARRSPRHWSAAVGLYIFARAWGTVYTSAKAIAIAAPLIALVIVGGLLVVTGPRAAVLAGVVALPTAFSSFLILRQAPVAPEDHMNELAEIRPLVEGEKLLFLGRDNFVLYELRGSKPFTHVRNFYDPYFVEPNFELETSARSSTSTPSPRRRSTASRTCSRPGPVRERPPHLGTSWSPRLRATSSGSGGAGAAAASRRDRRRAGRSTVPGRRPTTVASLPAAPVVAAAWDDDARSRTATTASTSSTCRPGPGISRSGTTRPVRCDSTAPGYEAELPGNLDYRGTASFWAAGTIESDDEADVEVPRPSKAAACGPPDRQRSSVAHLGAIAAIPVGSGDGLRWVRRLLDPEGP